MTRSGGAVAVAAAAAVAAVGALITTRAPLRVRDLVRGRVS